MPYTAEQIESIGKRLSALPPIENKKRQVSKQEAVKMLAKEIKALQGRGYTLDQIAESLRGEGLEITTPTLRNYLQRTKLSRGKRRKATSPAPAAQTETASSVQPEPDTVKETQSNSSGKTKAQGTQARKSSFPVRRDSGKM